ncbi:MAG: FHA domain-containing protein [Labilithrix sp.]|nr:FHA domain-containing protein [Labilithrix sp.]
MIEIVVTHHRREAAYRLEGAESVIGRARDAEVYLPDGTIARLHARLYERDGRIWIEDLRSTNGTWIDDVQVQRARVEVGQRFRIALDAFVDVVRHVPVISPDFEAREAAFLATIVRDPEDEGAREAYSAALTESGEHLRAQWLRAELALRAPGASAGSGRAAGRRRALPRARPKARGRATLAHARGAHADRGVPPRELPDALGPSPAEPRRGRLRDRRAHVRDVPRVGGLPERARQGSAVQRAHPAAHRDRSPDGDRTEAPRMTPAAAELAGLTPRSAPPRVRARRRRPSRRRRCPRAAPTPCARAPGRHRRA